MLEVKDELDFEPTKHIYKHRGIVVPSVTQLLNMFKLVDFSKVPEDVLNEKRILGTVVHKAAELLDEQQLDEDHFNKTFPRAVPYLQAYKTFREIEDFEPAHSERRMYSKKMRCAGTLDRQGLYQGAETIIDLKCSWMLYPSNGAQTSAYAQIFLENYGIKIKRRFALQLKETGHYELKEYKDPQDLHDFMACVMLYWRRREHYRTIDGISE